MSALRWTSKSTRTLAVSVDTKKKELIGTTRTTVRSGCPRPSRSGCRCTTSPTPRSARRSRTGPTTWPPTPAGRVRRPGPRHLRLRRRQLRRWWASVGQIAYPAADRLLVCATDGGGSNGHRVRAVDQPRSRRRPDRRNHHPPACRSTPNSTPACTRPRSRSTMSRWPRSPWTGRTSTASGTTRSVHKPRHAAHDARHFRVSTSAFSCVPRRLMPPATNLPWQRPRVLPRGAAPTRRPARRSVLCARGTSSGERCPGRRCSPRGGWPGPRGRRRRRHPLADGWWRWPARPAAGRRHPPRLGRVP